MSQVTALMIWVVFKVKSKYSQQPGKNSHEKLAAQAKKSTRPPFTVMVLVERLYFWRLGFLTNENIAQPYPNVKWTFLHHRTAEHFRPTSRLCSAEAQVQKSGNCVDQMEVYWWNCKEKHPLHYPCSSWYYQYFIFISTKNHPKHKNKVSVMHECLGYRLLFVNLTIHG